MERVTCNLCGSDDTFVRFPSTLPLDPAPSEWNAYRCTHSGYGVHPDIVQCRQCGLVYTNPRQNDAEILETYEAVEDPLYVEEREGRVLTFERHLRPLERLTGPPNGRKLLDVGAYIGVFVEIAARHNWDAWGVEPSRWAVEQARSRGLNVVQGTAGTADLPPGAFDVVPLCAPDGPPLALADGDAHLLFRPPDAEADVGEGGLQGEAHPRPGTYPSSGLPDESRHGALSSLWPSGRAAGDPARPAADDRRRQSGRPVHRVCLQGGR